MDQGLTAAQSRLCEDFFPVAGKYAAHFCERLHVSDQDSVESEMIDAMIRVIQKHGDPDIKLVKKAMWDAAIDWVRREDIRSTESLTDDDTRRRHEQWKAESVDDNLTPSDYCVNGGDPLEGLIAKEQSILLSQHMMELSPREHAIVTEHSRGRSFREIEKSVGIPWTQCRSIYNQCINKLRVKCGVV